MSSFAGNTPTQETADYSQNFCSRTNGIRCSICLKEFKQMGNLVKHIKYIHRNGDGVQNCTWPGCSKTFNRKDSLKLHLSRHKDSEKNLHCNVCDSSLKSADRYSMHMEMHKNKDGGVSYLCQTCGKLYYHKHLLKNHEKSHKARPKTSVFVCDFCGKSFAFQSSLNLHRRRVHTKEKTHFCTECAEGFYCKDELNRHTAILHKRHDFYTTCHVCGKSVRWAIIKQHLRTVHPKCDRVECQLCEKDFKSPYHLNGHMRDAHGNREVTCTWPNW